MVSNAVKEWNTHLRTARWIVDVLREAGYLFPNDEIDPSTIMAVGNTIHMNAGGFEIAMRLHRDEWDEE